MLLGLLVGCTPVSAQDRLFLPLSLDYLGVYSLPKQTFEGVPVGGLSAIAYDRQRDRLYALSDDRSHFGPARFYTLKLTIEPDSSSSPHLTTVEIEQVTSLLNGQGQPYAEGSIDPEGLAIAPQSTLYISSEGDASRNIPPFVGQFDLTTGQLQQTLPLPSRHLPQTDPPRGIRNNLGFESLTLSPTGLIPAQGEPLRLFTVTEAPLAQDYSPEAPLNQDQPNRLLHYLIGDGPPLLIAEHLYPLSPPPALSVNGLVELLALDPSGHFLSLERSLGIRGFQANLFQIALGGATDTSRIEGFQQGYSSITPLRKRLELDLSTLNLKLDNLEGMTLGPRLPDGSQSLLLISDDNFQKSQTTQVLLFRITFPSQQR
jgi:hypothetical protein